MFKAIKNFFIRIWRFFFPKKIRSIKPTGTCSLITNSSGGIHPVHSPKYFRSMKLDGEIIDFEKFNLNDHRLFKNR